MNPRDSLQRVAASLGEDEVAVLLYLAQRLEMGARAYSRLDLRCDDRDFTREAAEEWSDGLIYSAMREVQRVVKGRA